MRILITGGLGYLGGRLAEYLLNNTSHQIIIGTRKNIADVKYPTQALIVNTLWNSSVELEKICSGVDVIIHTSGMNAFDCSKNPNLALEVNGKATARLLKSSIKQGVRRFIYLSTAHVYGSPLTGQITEFSQIKNPHPYATSHKAGEDEVRLAHFKNKIDGVVIRLSNSFGPPVNLNANCWALVTNDLCRQAIESNKMVINDSKMQRRDFISLTNVCRSIHHLIDLPNTLLDNGLFNIGGEWSPTILDVAKILSIRINILLDKKIGLETKNLINSSAISSLEYDITKIKLTNFKLVDDRQNEFDDLIHFCKNSFGG